MILNIIKLKSSFKNIIQITKRNYSLTKSVRSLSTQHQVELRINEIPNNSKILIGGYLTYGIPNDLVSILSNSKCHNLTIITNASIVSNRELRQLFKIKNKVKRIITSLENNRSILLDKDLIKSNNSVELNVMSCLSFIQDYCNNNENVDKREKGQYALVRSDYVDMNFNLYWLDSRNLYFNDSFAISSLFYSIAECDNLLKNDDSYNEYSMVKVNSLFVKSVLVINNIDNLKRQYNKQSINDYSNLTSDLKFESILKRVLLEFDRNNLNVYLSRDLKYLIESFYMPKHLNLNILNRLIEINWPSRQEWINYVKKMDIFVCNVKMLNKNGEIVFDNSIKSDCMEMDLINNLDEQAKVIAVVRFYQNQTEINNKIEENFMVNCKRKPNLIISDLGVFEYNMYANRFEMREYYSEQNLKEISISHNMIFPFQTYINENNIKIMTKQCF
jgi:acyl CoA:acetate/3-ketoacid CoA transferase alpha subunit